jgi:dihydroorotate dehydrogenase
MGLEIGLPPDTTPELAQAMTLAALGELPIIVRLPFWSAYPGNGILDAILDAGASAISTAPPRGALPGRDGPLVTGRLYGPALFPQVLGTVKNLAETDIPLIASGGLTSQGEIETLLSLGARAVQLDFVLWRDGFTIRKDR